MEGLHSGQPESILVATSYFVTITSPILVFWPGGHALRPFLAARRKWKPKRALVFVFVERPLLASFGFIFVFFPSFSVSFLKLHKHLIFVFRAVALSNFLCSMFVHDQVVPCCATKTKTKARFGFHFHRAARDGIINVSGIMDCPSSANMCVFLQFCKSSDTFGFIFCFLSFPSFSVSFLFYQSSPYIGRIAEFTTVVALFADLTVPADFQRFRISAAIQIGI